MEQNDLQKRKSQKAANQALTDLEQVRIIIEITLYGLKAFKKYKAVSWIVNDLNGNLGIIDSHIRKCKQVIEGKKE